MELPTPGARLIVLGIFNKYGSIPEEKLFLVDKSSDLFETIRAAATRLRALQRGVLAETCGFFWTV